MKFFDLEMSSVLSAAGKIKRGGRDVQFSHETTNSNGTTWCKTQVFNGGIEMSQCAHSSFKQQGECKVTTTLQFD